MSSLERIDHFEKNPEQHGAVDWNFNVLPGNIEAVANLAREVGPAVLEPTRFHPPIPAEWLHITLWYARKNAYSEAEMLDTVENLKPKLAELEIPEARLDGWWMLKEKAVPMLDVVPKPPWRQLARLIVSSLQEVVGAERAPTPSKDIDPHLTLGYPRSYERTPETDNVFASTTFQPVTFEVANISLVTQHFNDQAAPDHYEWEVAETLPIGTRR